MPLAPRAATGRAIAPISAGNLERPKWCLAPAAAIGFTHVAEDNRSPGDVSKSVNAQQPDALEGFTA
jgi:hypothetical protein